MMLTMPMPPTISEIEAIAATRAVITVKRARHRVGDLLHVDDAEILVLVRREVAALAKQPLEVGADRLCCRKPGSRPTTIQ